MTEIELLLLMIRGPFDFLSMVMNPVGFIKAHGIGRALLSGVFTALDVGVLGAFLGVVRR
jgi:hypothetical protein